MEGGVTWPTISPAQFFGWDCSGGGCSSSVCLILSINTCVTSPLFSTFCFLSSIGCVVSLEDGESADKGPLLQSVALRKQTGKCCHGRPTCMFWSCTFCLPTFDSSGTAVGPLQELYSCNAALVTKCKLTTAAAVSTPTVNIRAAGLTCSEVRFQLLFYISASLKTSTNKLCGKCDAETH